VTGYTTRMFNSHRVKMDYAAFPTMLSDILREMGHEVHHKQVTVDEKIAGVYNYAFCGVAPLGSITSWKVPETHHVMDEMFGSHCVYFDDWSCSSYAGSVRGTIAKWDKYID